MPSDDLNYRYVETKRISGDVATKVISDEDEKAQHILFYVKGIDESKVQVFISKGNTKLGLLPNFNLPARSFILNGQRVVTCPGASLLCRKVCYAQKGQYAHSNVIPLEYAVNYLASLRDDFVPTMVKAITVAEDQNEKQWISTYNKRPQAKLFRLHTSGDFYSAEYARKWLEIAKALPDVHFYAYTKAWIRFQNDEDVVDIGMTAAEVNAINDEIMDVLKEINALPNFQILLSTDGTTGPVPDELLNEGFKEAGIDFAYAALKKRPVAKCLYQTTQETHLKGKGADKIEDLIKEGKIFTCDRCGFCWDKTKYKDLNVFFKEH